VSIFNINGADGGEDFDMILDSGQSGIDWNKIAEEEYSHEFTGDADGDVFDPNDNKFQV